MKKLDVNIVAGKIGWPLKDWSGNCYALALSFVTQKIVAGKARYGHWVGPVDPESRFFAHSTPGFVQHGWVELKNGSIVDPTRFVFEAREPYIYQGPNDFYDLGGSNWREAMRESLGAPLYNKAQRMFVLKGLPNTVLRLLHLICKDNRSGDTFCLDQMFWLGNAHPKEFGRWAKHIYKEFKRLKCEAFIPQDYYELIIGL